MSPLLVDLLAQLLKQRSHAHHIYIYIYIYLRKCEFENHSSAIFFFNFTSVNRENLSFM